MAYENPYANTMNYKPRSLWTQPERPRTDWSTFWGKAEEDDDDNGDENGTRGDETGVEKGAGSQLKSLWGDVMADIQTNFQEGYDLQQSENMFNNLFGPGITATNAAQTVPDTTDYVNGWQNPNYTGPPMVTDFITDVSLPANTGGNTQPELNLDFITDVSLPANTGANQVNTNAYSPSYATQADVISQYPELEQNWSWAENMPVSAQFDQSGNLIDQGNAVVQTTAVPNLWGDNVEPVGASFSDRDIDFDAVTDGEKDWGDFW